MSKYGDALRDEMTRYHMHVRGRNSLSEQARMDPAHLDAILSGKKYTTDEEHRKICRAIPRMKAYGQLLLEAVEPALATAVGETPSDRGRLAVVPAEPTPPPVMAVAPAPAPALSTPAARLPQPQPLPAKPRRHWRTFGQALYTLRNEHAASREEVAVVLEVTTSAIAKWENDANAPTDANLKKIMELWPELAHAPRPHMDAPVRASSTPSRPEPALSTSAASPQVVMRFALAHRSLFDHPEARRILQAVKEAHDIGLSVDDLLALLDG